ncbi:biliverdin-producing heme oxygenase [Halomonas sp.]|uniref:biliverdin-producing heme oxygenase n=1 Tax=Halomonas sp. TaxID=1486246 RepID=UPI00356718D1
MHPAQQVLEGLAAKGIRDLAIDYPFAPRLGWLEADLEGLGASPPAVPARQPASPETLAELVGLLYVLEGSRLGARVIAERIRALLGDKIPGSFFDNADGERAWPMFRHFAVTHCLMGEAEVAIRSARQAFGCFRYRLDTPLILDVSPID